MTGAETPATAAGVMGAAAGRTPVWRSIARASRRVSTLVLFVGGVLDVLKTSPPVFSNTVGTGILDTSETTQGSQNCHGEVTNQCTSDHTPVTTKRAQPKLDALVEAIRSLAERHVVGAAP